jgi:hypothetical protein
VGRFGCAVLNAIRVVELNTNELGVIYNLYLYFDLAESAESAPLEKTFQNFFSFVFFAVAGAAGVGSGFTATDCFAIGFDAVCCVVDADAAAGFALTSLLLLLVALVALVALLLATALLLLLD